MRSRFLALAGLFVLSVSSHAQTVFSSLGAADSYVQNIGRAISGSQNSVTHLHGEWGWQFTALTTGLVREIKVGAHHLTGTNQARVKLLSNGPGDVLGSSLGSWTFGDMAPFNTTAPVIRINTAASGVQVLAGTKYWILMQPTAPDTYAAWNDSNFDLNLNGRMAVSSDGTNYNYANNIRYSAFSISTVPEPASMLMLGAPALVLARRRRK